MEKIVTKNAPEAVGPYSQAIKSGKFVFVSGQIALKGDIAEQTEFAINSIVEILKASGSDITKVVKTNCFLSDINNFAVFNGIYAKYFTSLPARSLIEAKALPKGSLVEIEVIAEI